MQTVLTLLRENAILTIIGAITIIQIVPIKIDPWSMLGKTIKSWMVGDIETKLDSLSHEVMGEKVNTIRWNILSFANSCRQGVKHTKEEWEHCINELKWYEDYCVKKEIPNGVIEECGKFLRETYRNRLAKNDFL